MPSSSASAKPASSSASIGMSAGFLQLHSRRASRCARDQDHARGDVERRNAHVHQPRQRRRRVVRVQRRQHQVAGLRGLDRDLGGLEVADLAHHDHVRVLAQERAQRGGERQAGLVVHVHLVDARQVDLGRVLGGRDVDARLVEDVQAGVERHRLAAAGRPGDEDHAVGAVDRIEQRLLLVGLVAERVDAERSPRTGRGSAARASRRTASAACSRGSRSRGRCDSTSFIRPSCGTRFSEMSSFEMTLMREAIFSLQHRAAAA